MKKILIPLVMLLLVGCATQAKEIPKYDSIDGAKSAVDDAYLQSIKLFSRDLLEQLYTTEENMNISPLSIHMILSLLSEGANGETKDEIKSVLHIDGFTDEEIQSENKKIYENNYVNKDTSKLLIANSIWQKKNYNFMDSFISNAAENYYAEIFEVDFSDDKVVKQMNDWVLDHTNDKINPKYQPDPLTILVLMNAVYLFDEWELPFDKAATINRDFTLNSGEIIRVKTMQQMLDHHGYLEKDSFKKITLNLQNVGAVEIILPNEGYSVKDIIEDKTVFNEALSDEITDYSRIDLKLPKAEINAKYLLNDVLKELGMVKAFNDADFSKMTEVSSEVNRVIHQTFFAFDEVSVEAAAVTIEDVTESAMEPEGVLNFYVDKPFIYTIKSTTGELLFIGVINKPSGGA